MPPTGLLLPGDAPRTRLAWSGDPLLDAKLSVPVALRTHVPRKRLLDRLGEGVASGPLTLLTGPAGTGKTTLAASWTRSGALPGPVAWLTLDAHDGAPGVFWSYVVEALRRALPRLPEGIRMPGCPGSVGASLLTRLAAATEQLPEPVVLVLDGFEKVAGRRVPAGLEFLLAHAGPRLRLVVAGRADPLLPLHRYRAEDRLTEIRGADLAFTPHETAVLLRRHDLAPGDEVVRALTQHTEGWAAGLRLCALAMRRTGDPTGFTRSFTTSEQAVSDYLLTEVLDAQPPADRELLLRTSVLDRVHPDLANVLTGRRDAEAVLARLARENAFVEPVPGTAWCRVHPLFAQVLRTRLRMRHPGLVPRLHARAAHWLADAGHTTEAIEHAAEAGNWAYGASEAVHRLLAAAIPAGPRADRIEQTFSSMPGTVPGAEPALVAAACRLAQHDRAGCRRHLDGAGEHLRLRQQPGPEPAVLLTHALLRLLCDPHGGGTSPDTAEETAEETAAAAAELMRMLPAERLRERPEIEALRLQGLARAYLVGGRLAEARRAFAGAVDACAADETLLIRHACLGALALAESAGGALASAEDHALRSLTIADQHGVVPEHRSGAGYLALATVAFEQGDDEAAGRRLDEAAACPDTAADLVLSAESRILRSRLELTRGRWEAALAALAPLPRQPDGDGPGPGRRLALARAGIALARGDHQAAVAALHDTDGDGPAPLVALARAHTAAGRTDRARRLLARASRSPGLGLADRVGIQLLGAHAAVLDGHPETARRLLGQALDTARPERLRRPFVEAGPWLRHLLNEPDGAGPAPSASAWLTARADGAGLPGVLQPLSSRERDVLVGVQQMMSADEIAAELNLSVNTVKTHLKSVYRKLCVTRRRDAVERARALHIL
ncbi:LuxR C-terminal-related transcriptional regulator [Streptomyces cinnamoneus]|uniref:LuxR C-terminal-related transcriptional regulator n=1 Tax=Streptomyces cinnamoneus TaxID=53446 RepID=UPI003412FE41